LITVLIPCYNAAETIRTCLESIRDMADEILVADAGSTDGTLDVAREFGGCRVIRRSGPEDAEFEAWAHGEATHPWILRLLPCEQLNPELARQVQDMAADKPTEIGFRVARTHFIQGRRLKHGGFERETSIRLYRKDAARYEMRDGRVEVAVDSKTGGRFQPRLFYESCPSIEQWLTELIRQAARFAVSARERGVRPSRWNVLWKAPWQFVKSYVIRGGWLDGWPGLLACCLSAITVVLREAFLWESQQPGAALRSQASGSGETLRIVAPVDRAAGSANADPADANGAAETTAQQVRRRAA
jgi:glycosyltransferase involved in cell wall biosynthesis